MSDPIFPGFRSVPRTGVIYVMHRALEHGYAPDNPAWANLGQGMPETGELPGAPPRVTEVQIDPSRHEYGPITGQDSLRQRVADLYNALYRQGKRSQYTYENVSISGGGRVALTRLAAALGNINMGHFLPDYTAYEELLSVFKAFIPIPILLDPDLRYEVPFEHLKKEILGRGLRAMLASNPCNPTGQLVEGERLRQWVQLAINYRCTFILDEFYSHYIYSGAGGRGGAAPRLGGGLRGGRQRHAGGHCRRADQEFALSRLAPELDGGPAGGHRGDCQRGILSRRRGQPSAAGPGGGAARS